jgi:hypothetical protein
VGGVWHLVLVVRKVDDRDFNLTETGGTIVAVCGGMFSRLDT